MSDIIRLPTAARDDTLWAVVASLGKTDRIAEIFPNRTAALADRTWREQQVRAPTPPSCAAAPNPSPATASPRYAAPTCPGPGAPLPALGFLRGQFA